MSVGFLTGKYSLLCVCVSPFTVLEGLKTAHKTINLHRLDKFKHAHSKIHIQLNSQAHTTVWQCVFILLWRAEQHGELHRTTLCRGLSCRWLITDSSAHCEQSSIWKPNQGREAGHTLEVNLQWCIRRSGSGLFAGMAAVIRFFPPVCRHVTPGRSRRKTEINLWLPGVDTE